MNFFGIGLPEMAVILVIALLIFGPKKLPEIGRSMGKAIRSFQDASKEFENEFKREAEQLEQATQINPTPIKPSETSVSATSEQKSVTSSSEPS